MLWLRRALADRDAPWGLAWRLAFGQLVAWGVLYYAFTVVVGPMQAATGWSRTFLHSGVSLGLLAWGLCAYPAGVWIQQHGARGIMTFASALGGAALAAIGLATSPAAYLAAWTLLGAAMAGLLYEPAFVLVAERFGPHYRRGIALVTLVGGFASTVFLPVAQLAVGQLGWRGALVGLGVAQAVFGVLLHAFGLPGPRPRTTAAESPGQPTDFFRVHALREWRDRRFRGLALWSATHAAVFSGTILLLVPVLQESGLPEGTLLAAVMLMGPTQVAGRIALVATNDRFTSLSLARWTTTALVVSLALATFLPTTLATLVLFVTLFGAANGVMTILRGTALVELFGRERYSLASGALALPSVLARAAAPWLLAATWEATGTPRAVFAAGLMLAATGAIGLWMTSRAQCLPTASASPVR